MGTNGWMDRQRERERERGGGGGRKREGRERGMEGVAAYKQITQTFLSGKKTL